MTMPDRTPPSSGGMALPTCQIHNVPLMARGTALYCPACEQSPANLQCKHDLFERETACLHGYCPICSQHAVQRLNNKLEASEERITRIEAEKAEMAKALEKIVAYDDADAGLEAAHGRRVFTGHDAADIARRALAPETTDGEKGK